MQDWVFRMGLKPTNHPQTTHKPQMPPHFLHIIGGVPSELMLILDVPYWYFLFLFRDNGISIRISTYQIYAEIFMFLTMLIFLPIEKTPFWSRIVGCIGSIGIYVIQPIFYLNGDKNFRTRVLDQGIWKALKKELFQNNAEIQPAIWFFKYF